MSTGFSIPDYPLGSAGLNQVASKGRGPDIMKKKKMRIYNSNFLAVFVEEAPLSGDKL